MTYMGDPPATKYLKQRKQRQSPVLQLAEVPAKGAHQFAISPVEGGGWQLFHSPPDTDKWEPAGQSYGGMDLGTALHTMDAWRYRHGED